MIARVHRRDLAEPMHGRANHVPFAFDRPLVIKASVIFAGALAAWIAGFSLPLVAISAGAAMVAVAGREPAAAFARWSLLLFFAAIFVVRARVRELPLFVAITDVASEQIRGAPWRDVVVISAATAVLSNLVSNVPAVVLWVPVVPRLPDPHFAWLTIALSSTMAGNLTLIGSMANLIVAERAQALGVRLGFADYLRVGVLVTLFTLGWGIITLVLVRG